MHQGHSFAIIFIIDSSSKTTACKFFRRFHKSKIGREWLDPSNLTSVYLVPVLHLLSPQTPFWPYGTHPFFPHAQTIAILFDPLCSLTPFIFQLSYAPLHSQLYRFVTLQTNLKHFISRTFTFILLALLIPYASAPYNALGTITPSWPLSPILYYSAVFSAPSTYMK